MPLSSKYTGCEAGGVRKYAACLVPFEGVVMTIQDLMTAIEFLQRVVVRGEQEERLVRTVQALEAEIQRRRKHV